MIRLISSSLILILGDVEWSHPSIVEVVVVSADPAEYHLRNRVRHHLLTKLLDNGWGFPPLPALCLPPQGWQPAGLLGGWACGRRRSTVGDHWLMVKSGSLWARAVFPFSVPVTLIGAAMLRCPCGPRDSQARHCRQVLQPRLLQEDLGIAGTHTFTDSFPSPARPHHPSKESFQF